MAKNGKVLKIIAIALLMMLPTSRLLADQPKFGALVEFNYIWQDWSKSVKNRGGSFNFERFAINVKGKAEPVDYSAEYTWYAFMNTLMHAWIGHDFSERLRIQGGVTDVPFGLEPYSFNNWWGDILFYTGFNTNYKSGVTVRYGEEDDWVLDAGLFKNDVFGDLITNNNSYYFNLATTQQEVGQLNARFAKKFHINPTFNVELGGSAQVGWLQNRDTYRVGHSSAYAVHSIINYGRFSAQLQETLYQFNPKDETVLDIVTLGAYGGTHTAPSKGRIHAATVSYSPDWQCGHVGSWVFYNDFSWLDKSRKTRSESMLNTTGFSFGVGEHVIVYNDFIYGKNMPYIGIYGVDHIGANPMNAERWGFRYNLNVGLFV